MYADGFKYWLAFKKGQKKYYRCCRYKTTNCPARCVVEGNKIRTTTAHDHSADPSDQLVDQFRKVLTQRASNEPSMELYTIYWEEASQRHSEAAMLYTFQQAESCMRKARRKIPPQTPNTLLEIDGILKTSDVFQVCYGSKKEPFFETTIALEDTTCVIFMHLRTVRENGRVEQLHIDASIEVTPATSAPYYLLTIHAFNTPLVYVIMTAKTLSGYSAVFAYLRERFSDYIAPNNIITDFEPTIHTALALSYPEANVKGDWFMFVETVVGQAKAEGMSHETFQRGNGFAALRMLLCVPLLPANYISPGLEAVKKWLKEKNITAPGYQNLCDYVEQSWINCVGADKLSIFGLSHTVRNYVHQFNKELMAIAGIESPMIWHMLESLTQMASKCYVRLNKRLKGQTPVAKQPKYVTEQENTVNSATQQWIRTAVHLRNPLQFLQMASHCITEEFLYEVEERSLGRLPPSAVEPHQAPPTTTLLDPTPVTTSEEQIFQALTADTNCSINYPLSFVTENFLLSEAEHLNTSDEAILEAISSFTQQQQQQDGASSPQQIIVNTINSAASGIAVQQCAKQMTTTTATGVNHHMGQALKPTYSSDPPPLAFYHKATTSAKAKRLKTYHSSTEPPPLVPISSRRVT